MNMLRKEFSPPVAEINAPLDYWVFERYLPPDADTPVDCRVTGRKQMPIGTEIWSHAWRSFRNSRYMTRVLWRITAHTERSDGSFAPTSTPILTQRAIVLDNRCGIGSAVYGPWEDDWREGDPPTYETVHTRNLDVYGNVVDLYGKRITF